MPFQDTTVPEEGLVHLLARHSIKDIVPLELGIEGDQHVLPVPLCWDALKGGGHADDDQSVPTSQSFSQDLMRTIPDALNNDAPNLLNHSLKEPLHKT